MKSWLLQKKQRKKRRLKKRSKTKSNMLKIRQNMTQRKRSLPNSKRSKMSHKKMMTTMTMSSTKRNKILEKLEKHQSLQKFWLLLKSNLQTSKLMVNLMMIMKLSILKRMLKILLRKMGKIREFQMISLMKLWNGDLTEMIAKTEVMFLMVILKASIKQNASSWISQNKRRKNKSKVLKAMNPQLKKKKPRKSQHCQRASIQIVWFLCRLHSCFWRGDAKLSKTKKRKNKPNGKCKDL